MPHTIAIAPSCRPRLASRGCSAGTTIRHTADALPSVSAHGPSQTCPSQAWHTYKMRRTWLGSSWTFEAVRTGTTIGQFCSAAAVCLLVAQSDLLERPAAAPAVRSRKLQASLSLTQQVWTTLPGSAVLVSTHTKYTISLHLDSSSTRWSALSMQPSGQQWHPTPVHSTCRGSADTVHWWWTPPEPKCSMQCIACLQAQCRACSQKFKVVITAQRTMSSSRSR